ncbi:hypothetical protein AUJ46_04670 [Candidatus Peregrinibacteria bacterium CG1_02_54_53]|nr:MAG: hypothetical protein AUJ46_04670 [Candidatus Peregrinibacteria bacterium CG1_02_54_53]
MRDWGFGLASRLLEPFEERGVFINGLAHDCDSWAGMRVPGVMGRASFIGREMHPFVGAEIRI